MAPDPDVLSDEALLRKRTPLRLALNFCRRKPLGAIGLVIVLVITEQVFNLNGIGRLLVQAVQNQDNVLAQALVMLVVAIFVATNLVVDVLYAWLDPRIRYS